MQSQVACHGCHGKLGQSWLGSVILDVQVDFDEVAGNVVKAPVVCGISSLGYDHMEILGNTLKEIVGEKAGILKVSLDLIFS